MKPKPRKEVSGKLYGDKAMTAIADMNLLRIKSKPRKTTTTVDVARINDKMRYDHVLAHQRVATSYAGSLAIEMAKMLSCAGHPIKDKNGEYFVRLLGPKEVVERAVTITAMIFEEIEANGWTAEIPAFETLVHEESKPAGFGGTGNFSHAGFAVGREKS